MLVFRNILRTYYMNDSYLQSYLLRYSLVQFTRFFLLATFYKQRQAEIGEKSSEC